MAAFRQLEFFLLRYVPDAVKDEFVNIGVVMVEAGANGGGFAEVRFTRDWRRVRCLDPQADVEMLEALERDIRGQLVSTHDRGVLLQRLEDSFSNVIQLSPAKGCLAEDPVAEIEAMALMYLESAKAGGKREVSGRQRILVKMRQAFEQAGVWGLMRHDIAVDQYTHKGDPLKIDCSYQPNGEIKMFQAVSLQTDVDAAKVLAFSYPKIVEGILSVHRASALLTAVVEDDLDRSDEAVLFALATLEQGRIRVAAAGEMAGIAEVARRELRA
ncbi:MAG TPA: DUF3037 domain-containing protein [Candidatus Acidoferrum sp.]|jgi:hypothetical protein|nr:DUF3037 domain-containing protein [Candidatus Acidoferrum sp.]